MNTKVLQSTTNYHTLCVHISRLASLVFILVMFVLATSYSGALVSFFTVTVFPHPIDTLQGVTKLVKDQDLGVSSCCRSMQESMKGSSEEGLNYLANKVKITGNICGIRWNRRRFFQVFTSYNNIEASSNVSKGTHITINSKNVLDYGIRKELTNE